MSLQVAINPSLIVSVVTLMSTIVGMVLFVTRTRWALDQLTKDLARTQNDLNVQGTRMVEIRVENSSQVNQILARVDALDKAFIQVTAQLGYLNDSMKELKEKLFKSTAII